MNKKIKNCGTVAIDELSKIQVFNTKFNERGTEYKLLQSSAGYECAGSMMRYTEGYYACRYTLKDGTQGGKRYKNFDDAVAEFNRVTIVNKPIY